MQEKEEEEEEEKEEEEVVRVHVYTPASAVQAPSMETIKYIQHTPSLIARIEV